MAFDSLFVGVTGLEAYQNQIDVISNNIANVGTAGYKGQNVNFQDMIYQAQSYATAPNANTGGVNGQQIGFGVKIASVGTSFAQGGQTQTNLNTNMMLNGDGFFVLRNPSGSSAPVYTRNGAFSLNPNGLLYDGSNGLAVQGYTADKFGNIAGAGTPGNITIPLGLTSQAVGTGLNPSLKFGQTGDKVFDVSMGGILDQNQWIAQAQGIQKGITTGGQAKTISTTIYDSLGVGHQANITYTPDASGAAPGTGNVAANPVLVNGSSLINNADFSGATAGAGNITVTVNAAGTAATISDGTNTISNAVSGQSISMDGVTFKLGSLTTGPGPGGDGGATGTLTMTAAAKNGLPGQVSDTAGNLHNVGARWQVSVAFADGTQFSTINTPGNGAVTPKYGANSTGSIGYLYTDQNGQFINTSAYVDGTPPVAGKPTVIGATQVHLAGANSALLNGNQLNIVSWGTGATNNSSAPTAGGPAPTTGPIGFDFSNTSSLAASTGGATTNGSTPTVIAQNGFATGTLQNITVGTDGTITGAFTNGQNQVLARVAVATFANEQGLQRLGGSDFGATSNSGLVQLGTAGTGQFGSIQSGFVEQSNVSIASEFTKMIAAQNAYQANSKSITVASENMQTVTNLIR